MADLDAAIEAISELTHTLQSMQGVGGAPAASPSIPQPLPPTGPNFVPPPMGNAVGQMAQAVLAQNPHATLEDVFGQMQGQEQASVQQMPVAAPGLAHLPPEALEVLKLSQAAAFDPAAQQELMQRLLQQGMPQMQQPKAAPSTTVEPTPQGEQWAKVPLPMLEELLRHVATLAADREQLTRRLDALEESTMRLCNMLEAVFDRVDPVDDDPAPQLTVVPGGVAPSSVVASVEDETTEVISAAAAVSEALGYMQPHASRDGFAENGSTHDDDDDAPSGDDPGG